MIDVCFSPCPLSCCGQAGIRQAGRPAVVLSRRIEASGSLTSTLYTGFHTGGGGALGFPTPS